MRDSESALMAPSLKMWVIIWNLEGNKPAPLSTELREKIVIMWRKILFLNRKLTRCSGRAQFSHRLNIWTYIFRKFLLIYLLNGAVSEPRSRSGSGVYLTWPFDQGMAWYDLLKMAQTKNAHVNIYGKLYFYKYLWLFTIVRGSQFSGPLQTAMG